MKNIKYLGYITAVMLMAMALILSCAPAPAPAPAPAEPIKIGVIVGLTGFMAPDALSSKNGVELKLEEVGYQIAGRNIELIVEDGASNPTVYVDKARKLVERDKVDVVLGPLFSPAGFAVADYLTDSRTPNITFHVHSRGVLEFGGGNIWMWPGTLMGIGYPLGHYAADELGYKTVALIHADNATGEEITQGFLNGFEERGGTSVQRQRIPPDTMDFSAYITGAKDADALVFWAHEPFVPAFITQYAASGRKDKMPVLFPLTGPASEHALGEIGDVSLGMVGSEWYTPLIDTANNNRFVDAYVKKVGLYPPSMGVGGYISATIFLEAVKATGGDTSHEAINNAIRNLKVDTPAGTFSFTPDGMGIGDMYIMKSVKIGDRYAWEPIFTYSQMMIDVPAQYYGN